MFAEYPSSAARHTDDLDLWIDPARYEAGVAALLAAGFTPTGKALEVAIDGRQMIDFLAPRCHEAAQLLSPLGALVELHRYPPGNRLGEPFSTAIEASERVQIDSHPIAVPSRAVLLEQICRHVVLHHRAQPRYLPRHLCDLAALDNCGCSVRAHKGEGFSVRFSAGLFEAAFGGRRTGDNWLRQLLFPRSNIERAWAAAARWIDLVSRTAFDLRHRPSILGRKIVPTRQYVVERYGEPESRAELFGVYLWRILRALTGFGDPPAVTSGGR